jgi:hypothetical protein
VGFDDEGRILGADIALHVTLRLQHRLLGPSERPRLLAHRQLLLHSQSAS